MKNLLPLNLQLFADPPADPAATPPATPPADPPTFDDLLKDKNHQAEFDRRVTKALETAKAKWQQEEEARMQAGTIGTSQDCKKAAGSCIHCFLRICFEPVGDLRLLTC